MNETNTLQDILTPFANLLVNLGVPAEHSQIAALGIVFFAATLIVLLLARLLLSRQSHRRTEEPSPSGQQEKELEDQQATHTEEVLDESPPETLSTESELPPEQTVTTPSEKTVQTFTPEEPVETASLFLRLRQGLSKTRSSLLGRVDGLLSTHSQLNDDFVEELEEILITADFGMQATQELVQALTKRAADKTPDNPDALRECLKDEISNRLKQSKPGWMASSSVPTVLMVVGVNGVGKTTTIGKLAKQFADQGQKVILGAGDTFRAAAAEQLQVWGKRSGAEVIRQAEGSDPAAVAFDAAKAAVARQADVLILDTAGRLHTKVNLMEELKKVRRVLDREIPGAPHETLLVLDATTGQNALTQAKIFQEAVDVTGIALTKLDGTAKGGIVVAIATQLGIPVRMIGIGEGVMDLRPFDAEEFVDALFSNS